MVKTNVKSSTRVKKSKSLIRVFKNPTFNKNKLPLQMSIIVPSTNLDKSISAKEFNKRVDAETKWFNKMFGGSTRFDVVGSYNADGKLIIEKGVRIESSMSLKEFENKRKEIESHAQELIKRWKQDSIIIRIEGQDFITPKKDYIQNDKEQTDLIFIS